MFELCNATESGMLRRGAYDFSIEHFENEFYFTYKMVEGGFMVGDLDKECKERILDVWNSKEYLTYSKIIIISEDKKKGILSFIKDGFCLQVPFIVKSLSLDSDLKDDYFDAYEK